jgi:hypothetical protein
MYLAGTKSVGSMSKSQFNVIKILATKEAWKYIGMMSDKNKILSDIAIKKIDNMSDIEVYNEVKDSNNFGKIYELLGIKSINKPLEWPDKFIKRIVTNHVSKLAEEYCVPMPELRVRSVK